MTREAKKGFYMNINALYDYFSKKYSISKSKVQSIAEKFNLTHTKMKNETTHLGVLGSYISY